MKDYSYERKVRAVMELMDAIVDVIEAAGLKGTPAGPLYASFMPYGCNLEQFQRMMDGLVVGGFIRHYNNVYYFVKRRDTK